MRDNISELHGFRSIALILVVFYHFSIYTKAVPGLNNVVNSGWMGVSLFFVLCGMLLSMPYILALKNKLPLPDTLIFYKRRFLRIMPLYIFSVIAFAVITYYHTGEVNYHKVLLNIIFLGDIISDNPVVWSLRTEVVFYMLLPLMMLPVYFFLRKQFYWPVVIMLIMGMLIPLINRVYTLSPYNSDSVNSNYYSIISNFDSFFYGILCSLVYVYFKHVNVTNKFIKIALSLSIVVILMCFYLITKHKHSQHDNAFYSPYGQTVLDMIWAMLIIFTLFLKKSYWNSFLNSRIMLSLATISYSVFIFHFRIYYYFQNHYLIGFMGMSNLKSVLLKLLALLTTLIISITTYHLIEKPFNKRHIK